ncbi:ada [Symbiodinium microadriaticum]|nr:ada [Symbiodinium microadriaticum]
MAQREVAKYMQPFENSTKESVKAPIFTEREKLPRDRRELDDIWRMLVSSNIDMAEEEDAFEWNFLWRTANVTAELGLMQTWPRIFSALNGSSSESVDWIQTRLYWERVLFLALRRLRAREAKSGPAHVKEDRSLADVALNLQSIFETKLCSPGALGGLKEKHLRRLGVRDEVALVVHSLDTDNVVKALWKNWMVLHIKLRPGQSKRRLVLLQHLLKKHSCRCMCYDACGKLEASASASCQALWPHDDEKFKYWRPILRVKEVVLDRVYRPRAAVLKDADIQVITRPALGGCGTRLEIRPHRSFGRALVGFPARCNTPDLFRESKSMDLKITLWSNNERDDEPLEWNDFVEANRPDAMWGNTQADDFDRSLFKPPEPTEGGRPAAEEDLSWIDKIADEYLDDAHGSPEPDDLDPEDSGDFDADDYADLDTEFLDSLLPESPVKSQ